VSVAGISLRYLRRFGRSLDPAAGADGMSRCGRSGRMCRGVSTSAGWTRRRRRPTSRVCALVRRRSSPGAQGPSTLRPHFIALRSTTHEACSASPRQSTETLCLPRFSPRWRMSDAAGSVGDQSAVVQSTAARGAASAVSETREGRLADAAPATLIHNLSQIAIDGGPRAVGVWTPVAPRCSVVEVRWRRSRNSGRLASERLPAPM
jgi:hypothetical protein